MEGDPRDWNNWGVGRGMRSLEARPSQRERSRRHMVRRRRSARLRTTVALVDVLGVSAHRRLGGGRRGIGTWERKIKQDTTFGTT